MKYLDEIIRALNATELYNDEILYKFSDLYDAIKNISEEHIKIDDCIIMPYYVFGGRRLELYEYEMNIRLVDKLDFEQYLLNKTGKKKADDIPKEVILLHKNCYYEVLKTESEISIEKIKRYIDYLYDNSNLEKQIRQVLGGFDTQNLMFEFY